MNFVAKNFDELTVYELYEILKARTEIFLLEQNIVCQDLDGLDQISRHYFIDEDGKVLACLRAFYVDGERKVVKIGRVVTLTHKQGHGRALMDFALDDIKSKMPCESIYVNAQTQAEGFYAKMGFVTVSDVFDEDGIPHVKMILK